ncbi:GNAT family N-acetyltransferase [Streptomyces sp. WM6386]|uniref:GNAT family N-acetyltransferase n=1 Tax=Streptomyces sp. WM6386 TaxID=1415558 RepID=UPI00131AA5ED
MWWDDLATRPARAATEIVLLDHDDHLIGRLRFRACPACRTGRILDIWVCDAWQHQGLGRELLQDFSGWVKLLKRYEVVAWGALHEYASARSAGFPFPGVSRLSAIGVQW